MTLSFHAESVAVADPDGHCLLVGFADRADGAGQYLMLQRPFEDDAADAYYLELGDQGRATYGGIGQCLLARDSIAFSFLPAAAAALDGVDEVRITFDLDEPAFRLLRQRLKDVFRGEGCLVIALEN
jgi:hypothetical protein